MSFNYLGTNIHSVVPLVGNMSNRANFLQSHIPNQNNPQNITSSGSLIPLHLQAAALNDNPLEFNSLQQNDIKSVKLATEGESTNAMSTTLSTVSQVKRIENNSNRYNDQTNKKKLHNSAQGAAPMDIETETERLSNATSTIAAEINKRLAKREIQTNIEDECGIASTLESVKQSNSLNNSGVLAPKLLIGNDIFLNSMVGVAGPTQSSGFMMMSGMVMDHNALATGFQMQPFSQHQLLQAQLAQFGPNQHTLGSNTSHLGSINSQKISEQQQQQSQPMKEIISCKSCILYPPDPNAPPPTIRERPPGCRTVFVGGLPDRITEEIIREIFENCGEITTLRLSKKNFCHIRFVFESSVDSAMYLSGYRIRINNSTEACYCGRMHVDYAQARDDQYEWECKQRQLQREQRHRERMERDRLRSLSPPPIVHYSDHEAGNIAEKLKSDDTFIKAVQTLVAWLERGDLNKKNANTFYTMIQSTNAHVRRLQNDKNEFEDSLKKAREQFRKQMLNMAQQFSQIEKVFNAASHKKVWDHFTKAQRKNIDHWKKTSTEIRSIQIDDDEMEMSEDERDVPSTSSKRTKYDNLRDENDSLRCQLEAYKNEMNLVKSDQKSDTDFREKQIKVLQETIRNMQTQLLDNKMKEKELTTKILDLEEKLKQANVKELLLKTKIANNKINTTASLKSCENLEEEENKGKEPIVESSQNTIFNNLVQIKQESNFQQQSIISHKIEVDEAHIIGLVSTFLVVHPFGASPDYICSYLQKMHPTLRSRDLEEILSKYKNLFHEEISGIGMKIERKWKFCGFEIS